MKKLIALLLTLALLVSSLFVLASCGNNDTPGDDSTEGTVDVPGDKTPTIPDDPTNGRTPTDLSCFKYKETDTEVTITGVYSDVPEEVVIPATINGKPVTTIGVAAFASMSIIREIYIPTSVTKIEDGAFANCAKLHTIGLPDTITSLGASAFSGCKNLTAEADFLPANITELKDRTFEGCVWLSTMDIPEGVTTIGNYVFNGCIRIASITLSENITSIGLGAFSGCKILKKFYVKEGSDADLWLKEEVEKGSIQESYIKYEEN